MDFEKKLNRMDDLVVKMEAGDLTLEDSLKIFEEGVNLSRDCNSQLNEAEQKVKILLGVDSDGKPVLGDFAALAAE